jgi:hypothetical protein
MLIYAVITFVWDLGVSIDHKYSVVPPRRASSLASTCSHTYSHDKRMQSHVRTHSWNLPLRPNGS